MRVDEFHALSPHAVHVHPAAAFRLQDLWDRGGKLVSFCSSPVSLLTKGVLNAMHGKDRDHIFRQTYLCAANLVQQHAQYSCITPTSLLLPSSLYHLPENFGYFVSQCPLEVEGQVLHLQGRFGDQTVIKNSCCSGWKHSDLQHQCLRYEMRKLTIWYQTVM